MARHTQWHISGWKAVALLPLMLPVAFLMALGERLGLLQKTADLTAVDILSYLENFIQGRGDDWDWDDFTSIPITDPSLDAIRQEAELVMLPIDENGKAKLRELLTRVRSLA